MPDYRFEPLRGHPEQEASVLLWLHEAFFGPQGMQLAATEERIRQRMGSAPLPRLWVALEGGEAIGTVSLELAEHPVLPGLHCCLAGLYVPPSQRRRGIGAWLCQRAQAEAARLGHPSLTLYTPNAEEYYKKLGWKTSLHAAITTANGLEWCAVMVSPGLPELNPARPPER
jgi:predicted N-acetyltransferase YhbS